MNEATTENVQSDQNAAETLVATPIASPGWERELKTCAVFDGAKIRTLTYWEDMTTGERYHFGGKFNEPTMIPGFNLSLNVSGEFPLTQCKTKEEAIAAFDAVKQIAVAGAAQQIAAQMVQQQEAQRQMMNAMSGRQRVNDAVNGALRSGGKLLTGG